LIEGINDENLENKIAAIKALGSINYIKAAKRLNQIVSSEDNNQVRLASVISLGQLKDISSLNILITALDDEEANIRWDAAIALTKMGSDKGQYILEKLLNREYYSNYPNVDNNEIDNTILTILALISTEPIKILEDELNILSEKEQNIKIREFSMKILNEHY
jgi:hypothetical protein